MGSLCVWCKIFYRGLRNFSCSFFSPHLLSRPPPLWRVRAIHPCPHYTLPYLPSNLHHTHATRYIYYLEKYREGCVSRVSRCAPCHNIRTSRWGVMWRRGAEKEKAKACVSCLSRISSKREKNEIRVSPAKICAWNASRWLKTHSSTLPLWRATKR